MMESCVRLTHPRARTERQNKEEFAEGEMYSMLSMKQPRDKLNRQNVTRTNERRSFDSPEVECEEKLATFIELVQGGRIGQIYYTNSQH